MTRVIALSFQGFIVTTHYLRNDARYVQGYYDGLIGSRIYTRFRLVPKSSILHDLEGRKRTLLHAEKMRLQYYAATLSFWKYEAYTYRYSRPGVPR